MKLIETRLPLSKADIDSARKFHNKLEYLIKNPQFHKAIMDIRSEFRIPAFGIKNIEKNFELLAALQFNDAYLRTLRIRRKSRKELLQNKVKMILDKFELPERFREFLTQYIIENKFCSISGHLCRCCVRVYDDRGEKRVLIEVFGDTQKQDLLKVWPQVESAQEGYNLKGKHLVRYKKFYRDKLIFDNLQPVDEYGDPIKDEKIEMMNYDHKNIAKDRYKKYIKK